MIRCPNCKNQLPENAEICNFCGSSMIFNQQFPASSGYEGGEKNPQPKKSSKGIIIAVIAVVVALAIGVGGFFIGKNLSSNDDSSDDKKSNTVLEDDKNKENNNEVKNKEIERIKKKGTLVVGVTEFAPMGYKENGKWIGFDIELAKAFAEELGVKVEFKEIVWDQKVMLLNDGSIDCVWNGLDVSAHDIDGMDCSDYYLKESQIIVVNESSPYISKSELPLDDMRFAVSSWSLAEDIAKEAGLNYASVTDEMAALSEVRSGVCDAAIVDSMSAGAFIGEKGTYSSLVSLGEIHKTYFVVGFRKGSELTAEVNDFLQRKQEDGTIEELAQKYDVEKCLITDDIE